MKERAPDVSFIVATYNAAPFVEAAIRSALHQTGVSVEIIAVDDASTDGTTDIVAAMAAADPRVILIRRTSNGGPSAARNLGMAKASGTWVAILDCDDLVAPERSRRLIDLGQATAADVVGDNFERFIKESDTGGATMIPRGTAPYALTVDAGSFLRGNQLFGREKYMFGAVKCMFRMEFLRTAKVVHVEGVHFGEDFLYLLACLMAGARFIVTSESYYRYRMRPGSVSWRLKTEHLQQIRRGIEASRFGERFAGNAEVIAAVHAFERSLNRAAAFTTVVERAKAGNYAGALKIAASCCNIWPLIARFGSAAAFKRVKKLVA